MSELFTDYYNHEEMSEDEIFAYFQNSTVLPNVMFRDEVEVAQKVVFSRILPLYKKEIQDYDSLLKGKTVIAFGFSNNQKRFLKRHVEKHGGVFRFTQNGKENFFVLYSGTNLSSMLYALKKSREEGAIIINYDDFVRNLGELFSDEQENNRKYEEQKRKVLKTQKAPIYVTCNEEYLANIPQTQLSNISLEDDVFHVIGRIEYDLWDNKKGEYRKFNKQSDVYDFISEKGGQYRKNQSNNISCVIYGKEPPKDTIDGCIGSLKLIELESFIEWLNIHKYNVCDEENLALIPWSSGKDLSLEDDVFYVIGEVNYSYLDIDSPKDIYSIIHAKGGNYSNSESKEITCLICGKYLPKDVVKRLQNIVKFIDADNFIEWLLKQIPINKKCREFSKKYTASDDTTLRPYQQFIKREIFKKWNSFFNVMLQLPTGTGKTVLFTSIIRDLTEDKDIKILILAHRKELIDQISEHLTLYDIDHGIISSGRKRDPDKLVQVASVQTLTHDNNVELLDELNPKFIIIDEAHHSLAVSYTKFWKKCGDCWKLGVTATPYRLNNKSFRSHFDVLVQSMEIDDFISQGYLTKYDYMVDNPKSSLSQTIKSIKEKSSTGDYKTATLLKELNVPQHIQRLIVCYEQYVRGLKGIVYAINKEHAHNICDAYKLIGVEAVYIDSDTSKRERTELVEKFKSGIVQVMVNVDIFSEGFDCPDVEFIQLARPTWSLAKYLQQVGRGMRPCKGKVKTVILDNARMFVKFGLPSETRMWQFHFEGNPLVNNNYKKDDEIREMYLSHICGSSDEMMVMIDKDVKNIAEMLAIKESEKDLGMGKVKYSSARNIWYLLGIILVMSLVLVIIWKLGLLIPLGILGLIISGIIKIK